MIVNNRNPRPRTPRDDAYLFLCFLAGFGLLASVWYEVAWPFFVCSGIGLVVYLVVVFRQIDHEHNLQKTREAGRVDVQKIEAAKRPTQVIDATPRPQLVQPLPNIMPPKSEMHLLQTSENRFVRPEAQPVQGNGANLNGWPSDTEALRIAFGLMLDGKLPTRKNFTERGLNGGTRYENIRAWLIGAGLAQSNGDGNPTLWTSDIYNFDIQASIKKYLSLSPTLAE